MILFISPYQNASHCATQIERATHEEVKAVDSVKTGLSALRTQEFSVVVADENLLECSPGSAEVLVERMQSDVPVFLDMACMSAERISKHVQLAVRRREVEYKTARQVAAAELHAELKSEVTGMLISSEMAMKIPSLPPKAAEQLATVLESAKRIRQKLQSQ